MASPLEMYSKLGLANQICSAKLLENGQWPTTAISSSVSGPVALSRITIDYYIYFKELSTPIIPRMLQDILGFNHSCFISLILHCGMSAILHIKAESQAYVSFLSLDVIHPLHYTHACTIYVHVSCG